MSRELIGMAIAIVGLAIVALALLRRAEVKKAQAAAIRRGAAKKARARASSKPSAASSPAASPPTTEKRPAATTPAVTTADGAGERGPVSGRSASPAPVATPDPTDVLPSLHEEDDDDDVTRITLRSHVERARDGRAADDGDDEDEDVAAATLAHPILFDEDAGVDEPTGPVAMILVSGAAVTDRGKVRRRNEDAFFTEDDRGLYVVADGMGGYAGGDVASHLAVETMVEAFTASRFGATRWSGLPRRAMELAGAIDLANAAVFARAKDDARLRGMGTTVVGAHFSPKKQRLYLGHVGDSRCYRIRGGKITAMTEDHTLASVGVVGPAGARLVRAVGIQSHVEIDLIIAKPSPGDVYLLCSDGLTKMASEEAIAERVLGERDPRKVAQALVDLALDEGGKDNVTVVVVRVERAFGKSSRPPPPAAG